MTRARVDAAFRGRLGEVQAEAVLALEPVEIAGQRFESATGRLRLDGTGWPSMSSASFETGHAWTRPDGTTGATPRSPSPSRPRTSGGPADPHAGAADLPGKARDPKLDGDLGRLAAGLAPADSPMRDMEAAGALSVELTAAGSPNAVDLSSHVRIDNGSIFLGEVPPADRPLAPGVAA